MRGLMLDPDAISTVGRTIMSRRHLIDAALNYCLTPFFGFRPRAVQPRELWIGSVQFGEVLSSDETLSRARDREFVGSPLVTKLGRLRVELPPLSLGETGTQENNGMSSARINPDPNEQLPARQREVIICAATGMSNQEIANRLFVSLRSVERDLADACDRFEARNRAALVLTAYRKGVVRDEHLGADEDGGANGDR